MDRDYFIIMVYCLVCEHYPIVVGQNRLRQRGFAPALSDEEGLTMEICGEYFGFSRDEAIHEYFHTHYRHFSPSWVNGRDSCAKRLIYGRSRCNFSSD